MKKTVCSLITGILVCSMMLPAFAENTNAQLRSDYAIEIDGERCFFTRADGSVALPILYNDTTYLPLRAIGEIMGKNVNWDESTKTVILSGNREETDEKINIVAAESKDIMVQERWDFVIEIDGVSKEFKTSSGSRMNPIIYNGSTYLSLRAIGEIMDKDIAWNGGTNTVSLTSKRSSKREKNRFKTDDNSAEITSEYEDDNIGMDKAKEIAVANAKLIEKDVSFVNTKVAEVAGKKTYQVAFYNGTKEYSYVVDALTGTILSVNADIENFNIMTDGKFIHAEKAEKAVLAYANVKNSEATFTLVELNKKAEKVVYKVAFFTDSAEYECTVDATSAEVLDCEMVNKEANAEQKTISLEEAKKIAFSEDGLKEEAVTFTKVELKTDDEKMIYKIEFKYDATEYKCTIDAKTGDFLTQTKIKAKSNEKSKNKKD